MPLFGRAGRGAIPAGANRMLEAPPIANAPAPRRGIFGRVGEWARTRDWERIGAALRDDPAILQNLDTGRRQDQLMATQVMRQKMEDAQAADEQQRAQAQRAQIEQIISALPPEQQALARLNPEGFVTGMMRHRFPAPRQPAGEQADPDGWVYEP